MRRCWCRRRGVGQREQTALREIHGELYAHEVSDARGHEKK
jgi:hypothetical protein